MQVLAEDHVDTCFYNLGFISVYIPGLSDALSFVVPSSL